MRFRARIGLSDRRKRQATWLMEVVLVGILLLGLWQGSATIVVNALVALGVAQLPPLLERDLDIPLDPVLALWLTAAAFFHALGVIVPPGGGTQTIYGSIEWWDHFTHTLSASVVAGAGYATVRALDAHSDRILLPGPFVFVFILLFVMAFGVVWEVLEFLLGLGARLVGNQTLLTQYGLEDSMVDLLFDMLGAVVVATWGTAHLADLSGRIEEFLAARTN
ncbi:MAG: hypothetical protein V5A43_00840 [Haloarculaceae archaeon]